MAIVPLRPSLSTVSRKEQTRRFQVTEREFERVKYLRVRVEGRGSVWGYCSPTCRLLMEILEASEREREEMSVYKHHVHCFEPL